MVSFVYCRAVIGPAPKLHLSIFLTIRFSEQRRNIAAIMATEELCTRPTWPCSLGRVKRPLIHGYLTPFSTTRGEEAVGPVGFMQY